MKKNLVLLPLALLLMTTAFAGGILTNSNQSAQFARMLSRSASTDLDAVYFNPAGLTQLENGFYFGLHNQSITQTKTVNSEFSFLHNAKYIGDVAAPVFPTAFAVYKLDNWAFSAGFGPNGGGGSAKYDTGLPSFEKDISTLVPKLAGLKALGYDVTDYGVNISFEGTSVFWGIQAGATYKINKVLSVYGGARYLPSVNTYNGSIKDISLIVNGKSEAAAGWLTAASTNLIGIAGQATSAAGRLSSIATQAQALVAAGAGGFTLAQVQGAGYISADQRAQVEGGLALLGMSPAQIAAANLTTVQATYATAATTYLGQAAQLTGTAAVLAGTSAKLGDKEVDTKQTGAGITPIIGFDVKLDKLNIGLKYEVQTTLKLTNSTTVDGTGLFPDGQESRSDIPAILSVGADYKVAKALKVSGSYIMYFDKNVNWGGNVYGQARTIDKNYVELALGLEYKLNDKIALSAGYLSSNTGVNEQYQSDFSYSNDSYTFGGGVQYNLSKKLVLDAGVMLTTYKDETKSFTDAAFGNYKETYGKDTFTFAIGIGYKIF